MSSWEATRILLGRLKPVEVKRALIQEITNHVWGGCFDTEGAKFLDMLSVFDTRTPATVRIGMALRCVNECLSGCGWEWLLRTDDEKGHYSSISKKYEKDDQITYCQSYHEDGATALIMSLLEVVEIERNYQQWYRHGTKK